MLSLAALAVVALTAGVTADRPGGGRNAAGSGEPAPAPLAPQLWLASDAISDGTARDLGLRIIDRSEAGTLFEADLESAYRLLDRGYFIARAGGRAAERLAGQPAKQAAPPPRQATPPHFGEALTRGLIAECPLTAERERLIAALADSVSADSIGEAIRFLTYDAAAGKHRSRFAPRSDLRRDITPYIAAKLAAGLGPGAVVEEQEFEPQLPAQYRGDDSVFVNVVARVPGNKTGAHYVLCAHYDAIAVRDPLWQAAPDAWKTVAAPGADDNATGVAALLEIARLVSGLDLDVGVTFVAFSGEELALQGSSAYVETLAETDSIIGVLNLDMLGYVQGWRQIALTYDLQSAWLADLLASTAQAAGIASPVTAYDATGSARGDHAPFWQAGIPAVMQADAQDGKGNPRHPDYHTTADTLGQVDIEQVCDNARLAVAYLARFAEVQGEAACDIALTEGSVEWQWEGRAYRPLIAGASVTAVVRAINEGGSMPAPATYTYVIAYDDGGTWRVVAEGTTAVRVAAGGIAEFAASWATSGDIYGEVPYLVSLRPPAGVEEDLADNSVSVSLSVMPPSTVVRNLHVFPNPAGRPDEAYLRFEILHPEDDFAGNLTVRVYDIEGDLAGSAVLVRNHLGVEDIEIGVNTLPLAEVIGEGSDIAPGLYICVAELAVTGRQGLVTARSKFAVAR